MGRERHGFVTTALVSVLPFRIRLSPWDRSWSFPGVPAAGVPCASLFPWGFTVGSPLAAEMRGVGRAGGSWVRLMGLNLGGGSRVRLGSISWGCGCFCWLAWAALDSVPEVGWGHRAVRVPPRRVGMGRRAGPMTGCTLLLHFPEDAINDVQAHQKMEGAIFFTRGIALCAACPALPALPSCRHLPGPVRTHAAGPAIEGKRGSFSKAFS